MIELNKNALQYMVGGLLYMPAFQKNIIEKLRNDPIDCLTSIAFCLEDSIRDEALEEAEETLKYILQELTSVENKKNPLRRNLLNGIKLPLIFVRVRSPEHLISVHEKLSDLTNIMTGYIFPKFDLNNAENYAAIIYEINRNRKKTLYTMPILETEMIADNSSRNEALIRIKKVLDIIKDYVLNVRVGVNDLGNLYGLRRDINHTVYDIGIVRDILINILNVFAKEYVVAGSVWNYFDNGKGNLWAEGLKQELILDRINGFIGKSAIHPSQLSYIFDSLKVTQDDIDDANQILNWQSDSHGVAKVSGRMNELKCHFKWAERIKILSEIYGVKNDL
ncbi:MAG: HpcH/HpaI aldolase/citrate lyase family protein [Selenomonadaceae bacterium]|nr:HpcH/HpaI aldolase/citrate lyase family protein [Selenomonadaceae bacterium]